MRPENRLRREFRFFLVFCDVQHKFLPVWHDAMHVALKSFQIRKDHASASCQDRLLLPSSCGSVTYSTQIRHKVKPQTSESPARNSIYQKYIPFMYLDLPVWVPNGSKKKGVNSPCFLGFKDGTPTGRCW